MIDFAVLSGKGLDVRVDDIPFVRGSWFQYYAPGWTKGYYSSAWNPQTVSTAPDGTTTVDFRSGDGQATGRIRYEKRADGLRATYRLEWSGPEAAKIEVSPGVLWAPAIAAGVATADGRSVPVAPRKYESDKERTLGSAREWSFSAPALAAEVRSSIPLILLDGRGGFPQDWARERPALWMGAQSLDVAKDRPVEFTVDWTFRPGVRNARLGLAPTVRAEPASLVEAAPDGPIPLVPEPKRIALAYDRPIPFDGRFRFPIGRPKLVAEFDAALGRRFRQVPRVATVPNFDGGVAKLGLRRGGYRITITAKGVSVLGEYGPDRGRGEERGFRMGLRRLADLAFVKNGRLWLPTGTIEDWPSVPSRGVHLFVGPKAREWHRRFWDRVLLPLGFDRVVLQCERTEWDALPNLRGGDAMPKRELGALFDWYRSKEVEAIPLIQSLGHMEWVFRGGKNLDLAINPAVPYTIDPRKPAAQDLIARVWKEAIALTNPRILHFGLDEIDMRGFPSGAPGEELATELWEKQLPFLNGIARAAKADPMLWGDMALHKSEAPDATNAPDVATAERRRAAIPKGAYIADWHYKNDPKPATFYPVLQLWKREGFRPVASAWYRPENVRGFTLAADLEGVGALQTTWAGYESNEESLLNNGAQFSAMVLAGDYGWSGRQEAVSALPYDPMEELRRRLYATPRPVTPRAGRALVWGETDPLVANGYAWRVHRAPILLRDALSGSGVGEVRLPSGKGLLRLLVRAPGARDGGTPLARIAEGSRTKTITYGRHVRSEEDPGVALLGDRSGDAWVVEFRLSGTETPVLTPQGPLSGLHLLAASVE